MKKRLMLGLGIVLGLISGVALAQESSEFPARPVKVIVPFTPGGTSDLAARFFSQQLERRFKLPFVVENRPGGNGAVAVAALRTAPADGYSILLGSNSLMAVNPIMVKDLPYDPVRDLKPLSGLTRGMLVIAVKPDSPIRTLGDLVDNAKRRSGAMTVGTIAPGYQLAMEWLARQADFRFINTPYKGGAAAFSDLMGGHIDAACVDMSGVEPLLKSGKLRAVAVTGDHRHPDLPDVPTVKESGYPDYVTYLWVSFFMHADTSPERLDKLAGALRAALESPEAKTFAASTGGELMPFGPEAMRSFQISEIQRFQRIADAAGIKPQ
ncbi:tripartite tricarboxylate transporter substrate binding protein [Pigmentiphaga sp. H8]|uniref:Bug family tripartite tricarboxylate transporter substrate binding protein n=1 Tax=Pigmentiphaga sp. H8 TaxID=2488560 RepID=UPI000F5B778D|nr:tripartite tricarboxylate transporter substrate binding protein [Pigmentiphaga sp. H8]AZG07996.1 tripartite tricarboxylate transporter substrate binding protein [Pigmentiphaga sp. H8]